MAVGFEHGTFQRTAPLCDVLRPTLFITAKSQYQLYDFTISAGFVKGSAAFSDYRQSRCVFWQTHMYLHHGVACILYLLAVDVIHVLRCELYGRPVRSEQLQLIST